MMIFVRTILIYALIPVAGLVGFAAEHRGQVKFNGLPVPGVTVTAMQGADAVIALTDAEGAYVFADLRDGQWTLSVHMPGFADDKREVTVAPDAPAMTWDLKMLPLEAMNAQAQPPSAPPEQETAAAPQRAGKSAAGAPTTTLSPFQRTDLTAAKQTSGAAAKPESAAPSSGAFADASAAELSQKAADGFLVNGTVNNAATSPFAQSAAFGNFRRGGQSLYNFNLGAILGNSVFDARSYSLTGQTMPKPDYNRMQGLFSFGGPLRIPKLLRRNGPNVTVNYQWARDRNVTSQSGLVPTEDERAGNLSRWPNPIFDPTSGLPFPGNVIPTDRISPQATSLLSLYPLPNSTNGGRYNFQVPIAANSHRDDLQTRFTQRVGRRDNLAGTFAFSSLRADSPTLLGFLDTNSTTGINAGLRWTHTFNQRLYTVLGYEYSRSTVDVTPFFANRTNVSSEAGIAGNNQEPANWGPPSLSFSSGIASLGDVQSSLTRNQTGGMTVDVGWGRGRHFFSMGGLWRRQQFNLLSQEDPRGNFAFTGASTQSDTNSQGTGFDFAGFLLGIPDTLSIAYGNADKYLRSSTWAAYITDDWRVNPGLTLNLGLRWEYTSPIRELYGRLVNLDVTPGFRDAEPVVATDPSGPLTGETYPESLIRPDRNNIQPRVAFAWRPFAASSMVVRGAYGVYFDTSVYQSIATRMAQQSPLSTSLQAENSRLFPLTMANAFVAASALSRNTFAIDPDFRIGYAQNWSLSVQRDLPGSLVLLASYLGSKGTRTQQQFLPNTFPTGAVDPCVSCPNGFAYLTSNGNSIRHAGTVELRRRLRSGFTASLQYTFAKSIDNAALGGRSQGGALVAQNWLDLSAERGLSNFDQRHLLNASVQYTTGMGLGGGTLVGGWRGRLLKDWTFATQITAGSGLPLTPVYFTGVRGAGVTGSIRPDVTGVSVYDAPPGFHLNRAAFAAPQEGAWGNAGRNSITGPSQFTLNGSLSRVFPIRDRINLDLRLEANNALNHPVYPSWVSIVTSAQFGLPDQVNQMRSMQIVARMRF